MVQIAYLFSVLAFPVRAFGWVLGELPRSVVGWERVQAVLAATGAMDHGTARLPQRPAAQVRAEHLDYSYEIDLPDGGTDAAPAIRGVTLTLTAGSTVALVGPTGSGKTTLAGLLLRLVDPDSGRVLLDDVDLRQVRRGGLAHVAALVPQQTFLFEDTVRDNVTLGQPHPDEAVWEALRVAQGERFVRRLADGLDTRVGERGTNLSGGQRQRIALARAVIRRPQLLVLDDATSAVDPSVEQQILGALRGAAAGATVLVVAYRMATIALADEVIYLEAGQARDRGRHEELLARCEAYAALVSAYTRDAAERAADADADADADTETETETE